MKRVLLFLFVLFFVGSDTHAQTIITVTDPDGLADAIAAAGDLGIVRFAPGLAEVVAVNIDIHTHVTVEGPGADQLTIHANCGEDPMFHVHGRAGLTIIGATLDCMFQHDHHEGAAIINESETTLDNIKLGPAFHARLLVNHVDAIIRDSDLTYTSTDGPFMLAGSIALLPTGVSDLVLRRVQTDAWEGTSAIETTDPSADVYIFESRLANGHRPSPENRDAYPERPTVVTNGGYARIEDSTIHNVDSFDTPPILNTGRLRFVNNTVYDNDVGEGVGGIDNDGTATLINNTFLFNFGELANVVKNDGTLTMYNNVSRGHPYNRDCVSHSVASVSGGNNAFERHSYQCPDWLSIPPDKTIEDTVEIVSDTVHVVPLVPGSLLIAAANAAECPRMDQRAVPRHTPCDIGAYEAIRDPSHVAVTGFFLVDARTGEDLRRVDDRDTVFLNEYPDRLALRVETIPAVVGSVYLSYQGETRVENLAPYAFVGDINGVYNALELPYTGEVVLQAVPYTERNMNGLAGALYEATFKIYPAWSGQSLVFMLVNADTGADIGPLEDGDTLDLSDLPPKLAIRAQTQPPEVGSVVFHYQGVERFRVENLAPYALGGDRQGAFNPLALATGAHHLEAYATTHKDGRGERNPAYAIDFTVVE